MHQALAIAAAILLVGGLVLRLVAHGHLREYGQQNKWYNAAHWMTPPWKVKDLLTTRGTVLFWTSTAMILLGVAIYLTRVWPH